MQKHLFVGLFGVALGALGCAADDAGVADGGLGGNGGGQGGQVGPIGGSGGNGGGNLGGLPGPVGGNPGPTGGQASPGGNVGPSGGDPGPVGGDPGTGGEPVGPDFDAGVGEPDAGDEPVVPGDLDVEGDAELMSLIAADEAACRASCGTYDMCGWLDTEGDPPETVATCEESCTYGPDALVELTHAASREALAALLAAGDVLSRCITALSCEDVGHYFEEDVDPYPCEAEETAYYAAADAAFPTEEVPEFTCADGNTVPGDWVCDGEPDCDDASDEADCPAP